MEGQIVTKHYKINKKIGNGAFGEIYQVDHMPSKKKMAIKFEDLNAKSPQLYLEAKIYLYLHSDSSIVNESLPQVTSFGIHGDKHYMIMELLGQSLEELFNMCNRKFSLKTVLMLAQQFISRLEFIHNKNIIHRDLKPDNFVMGTEKNAHKAYLIDFGLAKKYMNSKNEHIKMKEGKGLTGTARYASLYTHLGIEQSRRDDLESMMFVLIYLLKGSLPWQNLKAREHSDKYKMIKECKYNTSPEMICSGLPKEFYLALRYCRDLTFSQKPNYSYLKDLFSDLFKSYKLIFDYEYDWIPLMRQKNKMAKMKAAEDTLKMKEKNGTTNTDVKNSIQI